MIGLTDLEPPPWFQSSRQAAADTKADASRIILVNGRSDLVSTVERGQPASELLGFLDHDLSPNAGTTS